MTVQRTVLTPTGVRHLVCGSIASYNGWNYVFKCGSDDAWSACARPSDAPATCILCVALNTRGVP